MGQSLIDVLIEVPWKTICLDIADILSLLLVLSAVLFMIGVHVVMLMDFIMLKNYMTSRPDAQAPSAFHRAILLMDMLIATFIFCRALRKLLALVIPT